MPFLVPRRHGAIKPEGPQRIDWSHPIARELGGFWLLNEAGNVIRDLVRQDHLTFDATNTPSRGIGPKGRLVDFSGDTYAESGKAPLGATDGIPLTLMVGARVPSNAATGTVRAAVAVNKDTATTQRWVQLGWSTHTAGTGRRFQRMNCKLSASSLSMPAASNNPGSVSQNAAPGTDYVGALVMRSQTDIELFWQGQSDFTEAADANGNEASGFVNTSFGANVQAGSIVNQAWTSDVYWVAYWHRALDSREVLEMSRFPYGLLAPRPPRVHFDVGATQQTITSALDAAVRKQLSLAASVNAAVARQGLVKTAAVDAVIAAVLAQATALDAAVAALAIRQGNLDAALEQALSVAASLDAFLQEEGVLAVSAGLDAVVEKLLAVSASVDAALRAGATVSASLDGGLANMRSRVTALEAVLRKVGLMLAVNLDAAVRAGRTRSTSLDAVIGELTRPSARRTFEVPPRTVCAIPADGRKHTVH
jgi:hypothetical protein